MHKMKKSGLIATRFVEFWLFFGRKEKICIFQKKIGFSKFAVQKGLLEQTCFFDITLFEHTRGFVARHILYLLKIPVPSRGFSPSPYLHVGQV